MPQPMRLVGVNAYKRSDQCGNLGERKYPILVSYNEICNCSCSNFVVRGEPTNELHLLSSGLVDVVTYIHICFFFTVCVLQLIGGQRSMGTSTSM